MHRWARLLKQSNRRLLLIVSLPRKWKVSVFLLQQQREVTVSVSSVFRLWNSGKMELKYWGFMKVYDIYIFIYIYIYLYIYTVYVYIYTSICCHFTKISYVKWKPSRFSLIRLPFARFANGSLSFMKFRNGSYPFAKKD